MNPALARILLACLMPPAAAILYTVVLVSAYDLPFFLYPYRMRVAWISAAVTTWIFVAAYWLLLWRSTVRWTPARKRLTLYAAAGAGVFGAIFGLVGRAIAADFGFFVFSTVSLISWLLMTVLIWRNPTGASSGVTALAPRCPNCGYSLRGLQNARCPECGTCYTLEQLLVSPHDAEAACR